MNDTYITIVGNVVDEPQLRHTGSGVPVLSFRVASSSRRYDREKAAWVDNQRLYASVTCWRALAQNVAASVHRGQPVVVAGRMFCREYTKDEATRLSYEVAADAVGHDLARGTTAFSRVQRNFAPTTVEATEDGLPPLREEDLDGLDGLPAMTDTAGAGPHYDRDLAPIA